MARIVEVDEAEYNQMVTLRGVANKIVSQPAARRLLEQAHKLVDPNAVTTLLDEEARRNEPINAMKTQLQAEIDALKKEREEEKRDKHLQTLAEKQDRDFAALRREHRFTDEGIESLRKMMETKGILDVNDAHAIWEKQHPPAAPAMPSGGMTGTSWGFTDAQGDKDLLELIATRGEAGHVVDRMALQALQDFRSHR